MIMKLLFISTLLCCGNFILSENTSSPRIVIIGAGAAGIAAGARLVENGFNVTILEAEDRIGGRIHTINMNDYLVDMGAQWVIGEKDSIAFEMAWPLNLIERFEDCGLSRDTRLFFSSGEEISVKASSDLMFYHIFNVESIPGDISNLKTGSFGEYIENKYVEYFKNQTEITAEQQKPILKFLNSLEMAMQGADDWYQVSVKVLKNSTFNEGDRLINWKNLSYSMIIDVLLKEYPNPDEAIPLRDHIITGDKVTKINYDMGNGSKTVVTKDGKEYLADHVIFTGSLGVLKADHEKLFNPPLPESKVNQIEKLALGHAAKIYLYFDDPWWNDDIYCRGIVWTEADRKEILENYPEKKWLLSVYNLLTIEHRPKLLCLWLNGPNVEGMELTPENVVYDEVVKLLNRFFGHAYNVTKPSMMKRTLWITNENFRGTYSYPSLTAVNANISRTDLAEPIMKDNKPILQFAGEASAKYYATVQGAIDSGRREADRLINLYSKKE